MFINLQKIHIIPYIYKIKPKNAMILFLIIDIIPNYFCLYYFIILTILEFLIICYKKFNFKEPIYFKFAILRIFFYIISLFIIIILFLIKNEKKNFQIIFFVLKICFFVWNIFLAFQFKFFVDNFLAEGYLDIKENEFLLDKEFDDIDRDILREKLNEEFYFGKI